MSKARPDIWLPLYIGDYLADTAHLSTEQSGAYLHLLMHSWKSGPLPGDLDVLRRITRLSEDAWSNAWPMLKKFFMQNDSGNFVQGRLEIERAVWGAKKTVSIEKARFAAIARWERGKSSDAPSMPQAMLEQCPSPPPPPNKKHIRPIEALDAVYSQKEGEDHAAVRRVFAYYLEQTGRDENRYKLTEKRMKVGLRALEECQKRFGKGEAAENALGGAVDGLVASPYRMGQNSNGPNGGGKKYLDWIDNMLKDTETMEKRWEDGGFKPDVHS